MASTTAGRSSPAGLGDGQLRINRFDLPSRVLDADADLYSVPAHGTATWVGWDLPRRYAVYFPRH